MMTTRTTRRALLGGAAVLAASPALAGFRSETKIALLWRDAEAAKAKLGTEMLALKDGVPAWMRAGGKASTLGETRYQALTAMLKAKPVDAHELALIARAAREPEMAHGPQAWASAQVLEASAALAA